MKKFDLCKNCSYCKIIIRNDMIAGYSCKLPITDFRERKPDLNEPDDKCSNFIKTDNPTVQNISV